MALIKCPECGKEYSNKAAACPNCSCPTIQNPQTKTQPKRTTTAPSQSGKVRCPNCGSHNVDITFVNTGAKTSSREVGAATKVGRKAMKTATLGAWGMTGKRTGYNKTTIHNQKMALCKDCGHSWAFFTDIEKKNIKTSLKIFLATIIVITLIMVISSIGSDIGSSEHGKIDDFVYSITGDTVVLNGYKGSAETLNLKTSYEINGTTYKTDISKFQISNRRVKTLIINEGFTEVPTAIFNSSHIENIFFPSSMKVVYDYTLSYLHPDKGSKINVYFGGTENDWNNIFTDYTTIQNADNSAEAVGQAAADFINGLAGVEYDKALFEYHYSAKAEDLLK